MNEPRCKAIEPLVLSARRAMANSWAPFSELAIGAAVRTVRGTIFAGCRTESPISGLGVCAERNAINHALIHGETEFQTIAVVCELDRPLLPCGGCLQYLQEFAHMAAGNISIIAEGIPGRGSRVVTNVNELLRGGLPREMPFGKLEELASWSDRVRKSLKASHKTMSHTFSPSVAFTLPSEYQGLLMDAAKAQQHARVIISGFRVGAALLTESGTIHVGCNTESLIPALGMCAERNAVNHAVVHGETRFRAVAVVAEHEDPLLPCGACLQYLSELARWHRGDMEIVCRGTSGKVLLTSLKERLIV